MFARNDEAKETYHVAFDCGNSSFRIMLGSFSNGRLSVEVIDQVPNNPLDEGGYLHWDIDAIFAGLKKGLKKAWTIAGRIDTVGVTTWGIDFGLLGADGSLLANPLCYRNTLGVESLAALSPEALAFNWERSGIQNHPMNSLYQLLGIRERLPERLAKARRLLFIPDLLIYMFTGASFSERSIASTSQMFDVSRGSYSAEILGKYGMEESFLPPIARHGDLVGWLREDICRELGIERCPFVCTPSHDTASAVTAIPTQDDGQLFISSGTWSLIGVELSEPVVTAKAAALRFANEAGVFDTITFLKNSTGLYLLQDMKKHLERDGMKVRWEDLSDTARLKGLDVPVFDPNHPEIFSTRDMYGTLSRLVGSGDYRTILASCYVSLALCYRKVIEDICSITGRSYEKLFVVGGGCRDGYLNQLTADLTGLKVCTGPVEAASIGNLSVQRRMLDESLTLGGMRSIVAESCSGELKTYVPSLADGATLGRKAGEYASVLM
jgi:rhamnulokinase